jgi:hypothetical protein
MLHLLVLAELPVGREQIVEFKPVKRLDLGAGGLRIVHGGRNQVIERDILDIEGLADMRAAALQQLHDFGSIPHRIELHLDVVWSGCNLAEGERGGEYLDEDSVHCIDFRLTAPSPELATRPPTKQP